MPEWIYDIPMTTLAIWVAIIFVGYCWIGGLLTRPFARVFVRSSRENDIVGHILSSFGVFYGLLLGLIAIAAYQNFSRVEGNVAKEAAALQTLYEGVSTFPEPHGQNLRWLLRDYCRFVIKYAWPQFQDGKVTRGEDIRMKAFQERLLIYSPHSKTEEIIFGEALRQFNVFSALQSERVQSINASIPPYMWYIVIAGAILNIGLVWLFRMRFITFMFVGAVLAFFLGAMILLIASLDNPFRGAISISSAPFESLYWNTMRDQ